MTELQFKQLIDRVLRCREAEDEAKEDTKAVYAELKGMGYDKTQAGALVAELRKRDKNPDKFAESTTILDLYRDAYERASGTGVATHTHEKSDVSAKLVEKVAQGVQTPAGRAALITALDIMIEREESEPVSSQTAEVVTPLGHAKPAPAESMGDKISAPITNPLPVSSPEQADQAGEESPPSSPAEDFEPPAFLLKAAKPLRPNCLEPNLCRSGTREHCHFCRKAMAELEAA